MLSSPISTAEFLPRQTTSHRDAFTNATDALMVDGYSPLGIISVIDRQNERKLKQLKDGTLKFECLFKHLEFEDFIKTKKEQKV